MELIWLLDFYGPMLSLRQRELLAMYCEEDMSLSEIADQQGVTRQAVYDAVNKAERKLNQAEAELGLVRRYTALRTVLAQCLEHLRRVKPLPGSEGQYSAALEKLLEIESIEGA